MTKGRRLPRVAVVRACHQGEGLRFSPSWPADQVKVAFGGVADEASRSAAVQDYHGCPAEGAQDMAAQKVHAQTGVGVPAECSRIEIAGYQVDLGVGFSQGQRVPGEEEHE